MKEDNTIMYVDDEEPNLVALRAIFRREYRIITATSAEEAKELLKHESNIKVIISDNRMQGTSGIQFFESILEEHPDPLRIILTGFADKDAMIDSINKAHVFRFLSKPWNEHDLRQTIQSAIEVYDARRELSKKQKEVANNLSRLNKFIHSASNEMRSTLVSMHGIVHLVINGEDLVKTEEYLPLLEKGIVQIDLQLRNIINHYNNNTQPVEAEEIDLEEMVHRSCKTLANLTDLTLLNLRVSSSGKIKLSNDVYKVQLVFVNLISYALNNKKDPADTLNVDVELSSTEDGSQIIFTDDGKSIETNLPENIFDALLSGKDKNSITLYLVKEAIHNLKGTLSIDSVINAGTSYTINIPNKQQQNDRVNR
jgi:FixJ family two-component response regulator